MLDSHLPHTSLLSSTNRKSKQKEEEKKKKSWSQNFNIFNPKCYRENGCWNLLPYTMRQLFNSQMWPNPLEQEWLTNSGLWKYISGIDARKATMGKANCLHKGK